MTRYLSLGEVLRLRTRIIAGGADRPRDLGSPEAAVGRPRQSFDGKDLHV